MPAKKSDVAEDDSKVRHNKLRVQGEVLVAIVDLTIVKLSIGDIRLIRN